MKRFFLLLTLCLALGSVAQAQIPDGSIAPDFMATDIDGNSHSLYDLLNAGKTVYLDVSATWCGPCWNYHNSHAFRDLWEARGPGGTDEVYCFFIEGDASTNTDCLYGPSGCVGGTQGDWVTGTPYPIIDDAGIANAYQISYFPTIFCICPADKKVYESGQLSATGLWNFRNTHCAPPPVSYSLDNTRNVKCFNSSTGAINISSSGGNGTFTYLWSSGQTTQDLNNIPAGTYTVTISSAGNTFVSDPIMVEGPAVALSAEVVGVDAVGCNGVLGSITISGIGGWDASYSYHWQNGQNTETATALGPGLYRATVTDVEGCTASLTYTLAPAVYPIANIATPALITCAQSSIQLDATGSDSGDPFVYQWYASNGGHIVSGGATTTPIVDAAGSYTFQITNIFTTCNTYLSANVSSNLTQPTADAGAAGIVSCPVPLDTLQGSGSSGNNFTYDWTGGNVVSGGNTLTPVVGAPGVYTLIVTNTSNGCTKTSTTSVTGFNTPPSINTDGGMLTCSTDSVSLNTSTNSTNPTFAWTGPNGYSSNLQSPVVDTSGSYIVVVNDTITGCANTATAIVMVNTTGPDATATADALTCIVTTATVLGNTLDTNATYSWVGPNGFMSDLATFTVTDPGQYNLVVTDPDNGCTSAVSATVADNTVPPNASAVSPGNFNCHTTQLQLDGTGSSQGNNMAFAWSTPDGHIVSGENSQTPLIDAVGTYAILVSNNTTGCTSTAAVTVVQSQPVGASLSGQNNVLCFGGSSGSATVAGTGGNGIFSYEWSNGGDMATISNLSAGVYFVTLTDGENCTASAFATIVQPNILVGNVIATSQTMNGVDDGSATANPSGGTPGYTYIWNTGATTSGITDLAPGNYTVTVGDANGCFVVKTVTVNSFNCSLSATVAGTDINCFGASTGTADVAYLGGAEPLTFLWSNGASTQSVSGLAAGTYTVNITDANNCPATLDIDILQPAQLFANVSATNETASGANDGTATANPAGGAGAYTYLWSTGASTQSIIGLVPGTYTVEVTDQNGCAAIRTVVVNAFSCSLFMSSTINSVSCPGANNGSAAVSITGGSLPFQYAWSNGGTTASINNLAGGIYTATVTDANLCQVVSTFTVNEPLPFAPWNTQVSNPVCPNDGTGAATASVVGGTAPYTYLWNNGTTGNTLSNVNAGNYSIQVTDSHGCTATNAVAIVATDSEMPLVSAQNATVSLDNSGNASVTLAAINALVSDNCGIASTVISPNTFSCDQLGTHPVTLTATDLSGLTSQTTVMVTVVDTELPVVTCPADMVVCSYDNFVNYQPATAQDNCLILSGQWEQTSGLPSPAEFPVGTTVQTFTFKDASGNIGTCSFSVTVTPPVNFDNVNVTNDHNGQGVGGVDLSVSGGVAPYKFSWELDGVVIATTEDVSGLVHGNYDLVVTDDQGCTYKLNDILIGNFVSAKEPVWLSGVSLQPNPTSEFTNVVFAVPLNSRLEISVIDATGRVLKNQISEQSKVVTINCSDLPSGMYTLRFRSNQEIGTRKLMVIK